MNFSTSTLPFIGSVWLLVSFRIFIFRSVMISLLMFGLFLFFYLFLAVFRKATDSARLFLKLNDKTFALFQGRAFI